MKITRILAWIFAVVLLLGCLTGCDAKSISSGQSGSAGDTQAQRNVADKMANKQATPTDIDFSLERYNLIKRAYWVNGHREKANAVICQVEKPLGYIVLFAGNAVVGSFVVDGKVSSLNSYLTPDSEYYEFGVTGEYNKLYVNNWLADVDGTYGENDNGIFFFTPDGKYIEWTGEYLYSDIPFEVSDPVVRYEKEG